MSTQSHGMKPSHLSCQCDLHTKDSIQNFLRNTLVHYGCTTMWNLQVCRKGCAVQMVSRKMPSLLENLNPHCDLDFDSYLTRSKVSCMRFQLMTVYQHTKVGCKSSSGDTPQSFLKKWTLNVALVWKTTIQSPCMTPWSLTTQPHTRFGSRRSSSSDNILQTKPCHTCRWTRQFQCRLHPPFPHTCN